jgi:hypothetical protein
MGSKKQVGGCWVDDRTAGGIPSCQYHNQTDDVILYIIFSYQKKIPVSFVMLRRRRSGNIYHPAGLEERGQQHQPITRRRKKKIRFFHFLSLSLDVNLNSSSFLYRIVAYTVIIV